MAFELLKLGLSIAGLVGGMLFAMLAIPFILSAAASGAFAAIGIWGAVFTLSVLSFIVSYIWVTAGV